MGIEQESSESALTIRISYIIYDKLDYCRRMIKGVVESLKLLLVGERNRGFVFIDESNSNIIRWNAKQSADFGGKITPAWCLVKTCKFSEGVGLLEFESNERHWHDQVQLFPVMAKS